MTTRLYLTLLTLFATLEERARRLDRERGALTTEQTIITGALIGLAVLVVGAITAAVKNKLPGIK